MRQLELAQLSWKQAEEAFRNRPVILIPIGAVEAHGPHLPLGADFLVAEEVAIRAAREAPALVVPTIAYGYAANWRKFAGNISVRPELVGGLVNDIIRSLLPWGLDRFIFVNNHSGNEPPLELVGRQLKEEHGLVVAHFYPWRVMSGFCAELYEDYARVSGHGAEPNTSVMMYLYPDDVDMSLAVKDRVGAFKGFEMTGSKSATFRGVPVDLYVDMDEINPSGVMGGDPLPATPERGKILIERTAAALADFVRAFRGMA